MYINLKSIFKFCSIYIAILNINILFCNLNAATNNKDFLDLQSQAAVVIDYDTGRVLYDKNASEKREVEKKYNLTNSSIVLTNINLPFDVNKDFEIEIKLHEYLDIAIIKFKGIKFKVDNYPIFAQNIPEQGQSVCKLGFAFPEYSCFEYSEEKKNIVIKDDVVFHFPLFPMDGIVTRLVMDEKGKTSMFETSSPGIRGQSGGPVFSPEGIIYGIQSYTKQLDLNFDVDMNVKRGIEERKVSYTPFINLGVSISSLEIIKFLDENNIKYESK